MAIATDNLTLENRINEECGKGRSRPLVICETSVTALDDLFAEFSSIFRLRESEELPAVRQAAVTRLVLLRAECESCSALLRELGEFTGSGDQLLQHGKMLATIKATSHLLSQTLATCSFLLSEEPEIDQQMLNGALVSFAKLSTLLGTVAPPRAQTERLADFMGIRTVG